MTVMEAAVNMVPGIDAHCGGACACATCHVYVEAEWMEQVGPRNEMEEDMLDFAFDVRDNSLLSCQIKISDALDGLTVKVPRSKNSSDGRATGAGTSRRIAMSDATVQTDVVIIGAGPCGLFAVFELGLLDTSCHVIDILDRPGGQCAELYPEKPIHDIPALPIVTGQELTDRLLEQVKPFKPTYHFNQMVSELRLLDHGTFEIRTDGDLQFRCKAAAVAAGAGRFNRKKPPSTGD